jgi:dGTPase
LADEGGFSHNRFALTLVEELEQRYPRFAGLNLSYEVLQGQWSRVSNADHSRGRLLEVQVVDVADSITYNAHDVDDAIKLGLVTTAELLSIPLIGESARRGSEGAHEMEPSMLRKALVHELIDRQVSDVLRTGAAQLDAGNWQGAQAVRAAGLVIGPSDDLSAKKVVLEEFLHERVYRHRQLVQVRKTAKQQLCDMLDGFVRRAELLPDEFLKRANQVGLRRSAADYLAGMTDRFCVQQYHEHFS